MSIRGCGRLPIILFAFVLSLGPTSSFSISPRRCWTSLCAHANEGGDDGSAERIAPRATARKGEPYKFGDITRSVVSSTTSGVEDVVRSVTGNDGYHFGDLTKKAVGSTTYGVEGLVQSLTGNTEYKFGDLTRETRKTAGGVITYSKKSLGLMSDRNIHELVALMNMYWTKTMTSEERRETAVVLLYFGAIAILAYNFVANAMAGMVFAAAWTNVSVTAGTSPLSPGTWSRFLETKTALDMFFGGPCIALRAAVTFPWFFRYRRFVVSLAYRSPLREKYPIASRLISVIVTCLVANVAFVGGATFLLIKLLSLWTGVPVFPVSQ